MLIDFHSHPDLLASDVCVVGAGPIGIALALACEKEGLSVLLIESGDKTFNAFANRLSQADILDTRRHAAMGVAICRGLGGTSRWWGGRCVPFDDCDFIARSHAPGTEWPIRHDEINRYYAAAAAVLGCGQACFSRSLPSWQRLDGVEFDKLERWVPELDMSRLHGDRLKLSKCITVLLGATVTELHFGPNNTTIEAITIADVTRHERLMVKRCVLACGGLETTRLLLATSRGQANSSENTDSALGRYYMGHISGKIADIILKDPAAIADHDFFLDGGIFVRRRFTLKSDVLQAERLSNIAFWVDNPPFQDPAHKSGVLSLVWLALAIPPLGRRLLSEGVRLSHVGPHPRRYLAHLRNLFRSPIGTIVNILRILYDMFVRVPRKPGFLVRNPAGHYALHYHAEQLPNPDSRVSLSTETDELGLWRLSIDLRYSENDARSVVLAHKVLDRALRGASLGRLQYRVGEKELLRSVLDQASDGIHQVGTTRMGISPETSIVDRNCRVHGTENLFVASTSVFPSSGQANPTFLGVALALRLAEFLGNIQDNEEGSVGIKVKLGASVANRL